MGVGKAIRLMRVAQGLSQKELAQQAPCSPNYLSLVERESRTPSIKFVEKVGEALGVSATDLFVLAGSQDDRVADPLKRQLVRKLRELALLLGEGER